MRVMEGGSCYLHLSVIKSISLVAFIMTLQTNIFNIQNFTVNICDEYNAPG